MDPNTPRNSELINIRKLAIASRGGVRTRGGRLPPVCLREIMQITGSKKVFLPNIPERRRNIKKELETPTKSTVETKRTDSLEDSRGRGRGRHQKVFLQTEGTFLAEGPAARMKIDPVRDESLSYARMSRKAASSSEARDSKSNLQAIKELLESGEDSEDDDEEFVNPPYRLPLLKEKYTHKVKVKSEEKEIKKEKIKQEFVMDIETGVKRSIKSEIEDEESTPQKDSIVHEKEIDSKVDVKTIAEEFQNVKDDGILVLLQLPRLTAASGVEAAESNSEDKEKQSDTKNEPKIASNFIDDLEDGFVGKLRIMKSGRMKIVLGSVEFELIDGTPSESYREAVSIKMCEDEGDLAILGKIDRKFILCPDQQTLKMQNRN